MILIIIMYALFACSLSIGKILVNFATPTLLTGIRMTIAGMILLAYQYFSPHQEFNFKKEHLKDCAKLVFFGIYVTYILRFWGLRGLPSYKAIFLHNFAPFATAFYSYFLLQEKITKKQVLGLCIGFLGMIPILLTTTPIEEMTSGISFISWQELAIIISVFSSAYGWIIVRKMIYKYNYSPTMINGLSMTAGGILAFGTTFFIQDGFTITNQLSFVGWLAIVILISNILCHNIYGHLLKTYTATFISFAGFICPLFAAFNGWAFLGEKITWHYFLSTLIVFIGLYIFYQDELKHHLKKQD